MTLVEQVENDLVTAMKKQDALRLSVLRMMKTALKLKQVETGGALADDPARAVLRTLAKQRKEAADAFRSGGRPELADREIEELGIIEGYLPAAASPAELETALAAAIAQTGASTQKDLGKVIKAAREALAGKTIDGKLLSDLARARLGG